MTKRSRNLSVVFGNFFAPKPGRRKFKRVRAPFLLKYQIEDTGTGNITNIKDLSVSGAKFTTEHPMFKGSYLSLELNLPTSEMPVRIQGRVVRVVKLKSISAYRIAIKFTGMEPNDRAAIRLLIERMSRDRRVKGLVDQKRFFFF